MVTRERGAVQEDVASAQSVAAQVREVRGFEVRNCADGL